MEDLGPDEGRARTKRMPCAAAAALLLAVVALLFAGSGAPAQARTSAEATGQHVLVISVDGLPASFYTQPSAKIRMPHLLELKEQGSSAEGVVGVYPSVTYPAHTTLVTGRLPAEHGIPTNLSSREPGKNPRDWFWFSTAIKVTTLWDEARRHHLTTAAVAWPVTVGATIDWNVPEIWDPEKGEMADFPLISKYSTPGLLEEAVAAVGPPQPGTGTDVVRARLAAFLLKKYKPNLLLVHLGDLDHEEHGHGPGSAEAAAALDRVDTLMGELLAVVDAAGLKNSTDVFIVSDHGFLPIEREIRPNVLLVKAGLLEIDNHGAIQGGKITTVSNGGSFFIYWPDSVDLRRRVDNALRPLRDQGALWAVLDRAALKDLDAEPAVQLALEAPEGLTFSAVATGEWLTKLSRPGGNHGYLPFRQGLEASFIAWGPGIRPGVNLHRIRMTAIGPTILKALGIDDPQFGRDAPLNDIFR